MRPRPAVFSAFLVALTVLASCGNGDATGDSVLQGVGRIPGSGTGDIGIEIDGADLTAPGVQGKVLGTAATGNRLIVIGDSILAGTAARYGNEMCSTLVPSGWSTVVEAEAGQAADFGREVLRERIYEGWDAAVVFLGTNPSANIDRYRQDMTRIVDSLAPRPTLLLTTSLFRESQKAVNDVIRELAASRDNVSLLDWGTASAQPGVLNRDGVHPTAAGRTLLVRSIAAAVGTAPTGTGKCLPAKFTDDSKVTGVMPTTSAPGQVNTTSPVMSGGAGTGTTTTSPTTTTMPVTAASTTVPQTTTSKP